MSERDEVVEAVTEAILTRRFPKRDATPAEKATASMEAQAAIAAYREALEAQGYVVVPVEPTQNMLIAGQQAKRHYPNVSSGTSGEAVYRAMIHFRPK